MSSFLQKECNLQYFHDNGYIRKKCPSCGTYYWTLDANSNLCGDQPCAPFSFIDNPQGKKQLSLTDVREKFLSFFEQKGHSRLHYPETGERCPVVARWRSDIYLTIASIADFQPHVTSGEVPAPANPLVISQPCIRLNDLEEIGVSGRHLSIFEMMGHHAFNKKINEIYWKEETVKYCDEFFVKHIGIPRKAINYKEQLWDGGGNAGPCLEVLAGGLEIATLVFMNMREDKNGETEIKGKKYSKNPLNIVDTGYGLERIAWITKGTPTVYESVFPETIDWLKKHAKNSSDMVSIYSLADHAKCLAFMLGDGIVPSNVKAGYLARLIIRRSLRFIEKIGLNASLKEVVTIQLNQIKGEFPSLEKQKRQIDDILEIETERFSETIAKGENLIRRILKEKGKIDKNALINLYDTHGMPPDIVQRISKNEGAEVVVPENFDSMIAELHSHEKKDEDKQKVRSDLPKTKQLYYNDHYIKEFDAKVVWNNKIKDGMEVVLDQTAFYPEGGGQPGDVGYLQNNGKKLTVKEVKKEGDAIIHIIKGKADVGEIVHGAIDWEKRYTLMKHHTGTHLINGALRKILGEHIWQAGSQLGINEARFDFAHYKSISEKERREIEKQANEFIKQATNVEKKVMTRNDAEKAYGFRLYQGGVPPGNSIRVLNIPGIDVEACGGTHLNNTSEVEKIKILKTERIQDGVNRIVFAAGKMVEAYQKEEQASYNQIVNVLSSWYEIKEKKSISEQLQAVAAAFSVPINQVEKTIQRFAKEANIKGKTKVTDLTEAGNHLFKIWKKTRKVTKQKSAEFKISGELYEEVPVEIENKIIKIRFEDIPKSLDPVHRAGKIIEEGRYVAYVSSGNKVTIAASEDVDIDLRSIAAEVGKLLGGSGGGKPKMAHCGGKKPGKTNDITKKAKKLIEKKLAEKKLEKK